MTESNKKENISEEIKRAEEAWKAFELLSQQSLLKDAVSRLYYFLLHYIRALLLTESLEPKTHEGALRLFSLHFVKAGIFEPKTGHIFSRLMKLREEADYNPSYVFTQDDIEELQQEAKGFSSLLKDYLVREGWVA